MPRATKASSVRKAAKNATESAAARPPLVAQAYEAIKEKIINLHFFPGQYLNEAAICASLSLGRTPVHQALQRLQMEGMVAILPRKGIIVQPDSILEIMKILDSRVAVEPELARGAARRVRANEIDAVTLDALRAIAAATDPHRDPPDIATFTANDRGFHRRVGELSGNQVMGDFATMLHERSTRFWYLNLWQTIDVAGSNRQHLSVADAIADGDEDGAAEAMKAHIRDLRDRLERLHKASPPHGARARP
jgi:DNA-binding GntR family transcriptional regulator